MFSKEACCPSGERQFVAGERFISGHLVRRLRQEGYWVRGVDLKSPEFSANATDDFVIADLRERESWQEILDFPFDEAYQLAADMGALQ